MSGYGPYKCVTIMDVGKGALLVPGAPRVQAVAVQGLLFSKVVAFGFNPKISLKA